MDDCDRVPYLPALPAGGRVMGEWDEVGTGEDADDDVVEGVRGPQQEACVEGAEGDVDEGSPFGDVALVSRSGRDPRPPAQTRGQERGGDGGTRGTEGQGEGGDKGRGRVD